jgi:hypothetical protein
MRKALLVAGLGVALAGIVVMAAPQVVMSGNAGGVAQGLAQVMADGKAALASFSGWRWTPTPRGRSRAQSSR